MNYKNWGKIKVEISLTTFFCIFLFAQSKAGDIPMDSVGLEKVGNKTYIIHKIDPKETLFSLSRRYNVKVEQIESENPEVREGVKVGQIIRVPYIAKQAGATSSGTNTVISRGNKGHVVEQGQTLYSISRSYNVSVDDLKRWNNLLSNEVAVGQELYVSAPKAGGSLPIQSNSQRQDSGTTSQIEAPKNLPNFKYDEKGNKVHITENGQTLFSLSQIYNISVDEIKKLNNLQGNEISTNQEIIVEKAKEKAVAQPKEKVPEVPKEQVKTTPSSTAPVNTQPSVSKPIEQTRVTNETPKESSNSSGFNKVTERGLAEAIDESGETPKFLALHKTASVGTIIQVRNELNNLYIFARVIGKLPPTGTNEKLVVKLSKKAYDKLGAVDKRFPVEVSYVPNN